jgi:hypothetical protein
MKQKLAEKGYIAAVAEIGKHGIRDCAILIFFFLGLSKLVSSALHPRMPVLALGQPRDILPFAELLNQHLICPIQRLPLKLYVLEALQEGNCGMFAFQIYIAPVVPRGGLALSSIDGIDSQDVYISSFAHFGG